MGVIGFDVNPDREWAERAAVTLAQSPDEVFAEADFVVLALSLNDKTRNFVDARRLGLMKPNAYLINTARGGLVDDEALCVALREKRLAGAAIDVFDPEPLSPDSPLAHLGCDADAAPGGDVGRIRGQRLTNCRAQSHRRAPARPVGVRRQPRCAGAPHKKKMI